MRPFYEVWCTGCRCFRSTTRIAPELVGMIMRPRFFVVCPDGWFRAQDALVYGACSGTSTRSIAACGRTKTGLVRCTCAARWIARRRSRRVTAEGELAPRVCAYLLFLTMVMSCFSNAQGSGAESCVAAEVRRPCCRTLSEARTRTLLARGAQF